MPYNKISRDLSPLAKFCFHPRRRTCGELTNTLSLTPIFWWRPQFVTPERTLLVGCGRELGCDLALLIACPKRLSQSACLCLLGNSYHPLCPRLEHPAHQSFLWNKDAYEHVVEMPGNEIWQELASQHSVSGFHEGRSATMESQMPGRSCLWVITFLVGDSRETPGLQKLIFTIQSFVPIITVTYLSSMPFPLPISLIFNIQWKWSFDLKTSAILSIFFP